MEEFKQILKGLFITLGVIGIFISIVVVYDIDKAWDNRSESSANGSDSNNEAGSDYALAEPDYDDPFISSVNEENEYRKMMFGDLPRGTPIVLIGKVDQVVQGNQLRVATGAFDAGDLQHLLFSGIQFVDRHVLISTSSSPRALVGDYVAVKGRYTGTVDYKSVLGSMVKVPAITADYYEANSALPALDAFFAGRISANKQLREESSPTQPTYSTEPNNQLLPPKLKQTAEMEQIVDVPQSVSNDSDSISKSLSESSESSMEEDLSVAQQPLISTVADVAYKRQPQVEYPEEARRRGQTGTVLIRALVGTNGRVESASVEQSSGNRLLDQAALRAVNRASFYPYKENDIAQSVYTLTPIEFALNE